MISRAFDGGVEVGGGYRLGDGGRRRRSTSRSRTTASSSRRTRWGKPAVLEGKVVVKQPAPEDVAHLEAEGAGETAGAKVSIEATGVEIR